MEVEPRKWMAEDLMKISELNPELVKKTTTTFFSSQTNVNRMQLPVQVNMAVCDPNALNQIPVESDGG